MKRLNVSLNTVSSIISDIVIPYYKPRHNKALVSKTVATFLPYSTSISAKIGRIERFHQSTFGGFGRITTVRQESIEHFLKRSCFHNNNQIRYRSIDPQDSISGIYQFVCRCTQACDAMCALADHPLVAT